MKKDMNINSPEWCDVVFDKRNKAYGAYALRQSADKRYIFAFGFIVLFAFAIATLPMLVGSIKAAIKKEHIVMDDEHRIGTVVDIQPRIEIPEPKMEQPKMKIERAKTIAFTPPKVTPDNEFDENKGVKGQSEVIKFDGLVGAVDVPNGSLNKNAIDPSLLKQNQDVTGDKVPEIHKVVEVMPTFPGGESEMNRYLRENLRYPVVDQENGVQGRVTIRFVVDKNGNISNVTVLKGISPNCDREAVRVVKSMPKWIPGRQNGNAVAVYFNLPIVFRIQ